MPNTVAIPHLGASTPESEDNCAKMAATEIKNYLENGNIKNSVNFPNCVLPREGVRITIIHKNIPNMLSRFSSLMAEEGRNIENMVNKSKNDIAYTIIDTKEEPAASVIEHIKAIDGVLSARLIK